MGKEIGRGAESIIILKSSPERVVKNRTPKEYRHPIIDSELRKTRTRKEAKILQKLDFAPGLLRTDNESIIEMEYVHGILVKEVLDSKPFIAKEIGRLTGIMHDKHIIHGDLTTSNMILTNENTIKFIDFGLSQDTHKVEDKAVDLHLFSEAIESKHFRKMDIIMKHFFEGYNPTNKGEILKRLEIVEQRGRNKEKYWKWNEQYSL